MVEKCPGRGKNQQPNKGGALDGQRQEKEKWISRKSRRTPLQFFLESKEKWCDTPAPPLLGGEEKQQEVAEKRPTTREYRAFLREEQKNQPRTKTMTQFLF